MLKSSMKIEISDYDSSFLKMAVKKTHKTKSRMGNGCSDTECYRSKNQHNLSEGQFGIRFKHLLKCSYSFI